MESLGLRRTQSLRSLSGAQERSWVAPDPSRWERKSVFEMVRHYQSCTDLRDLEKVVPRKSCEVREDRKAWQTRETSKSREDRENVPLWGSGRNHTLYRSRSMDFHPQRGSAGTKALCALFESKAAQDSGSSSTSSSPTLNSAAAMDSKRDRERPLRDWRAHNNLLRDMTNQRTTQADRGRSANGLPESFQAGSKYSFDDKYDPLVTKRAVSTRTTRDSISAAPSVRDRSALYLSRAAAIDSTGSPAPPEFFDTPKTKAKSRKFQLPAGEMCSACLTPVYPMEKMMANKLILHSKCFFCKHCKKKLSLHNYSSLNGEFYCVSHYQQLFKRKGNYDDGFGLKQRKDQWLHQNQGADETDTVSTSKLKKGSLYKSNSFKDCATVVEKSPIKELPSSRGAEAKGKLKMTWPPEKNSSGSDSVQQTNTRNSFSEIRRVSTNSPKVSANSASKLDRGGEVKDKVKALANSFQLADDKHSKTARPNFTAEKFSSERPKPRSDTASPSMECAKTVTSDEKEMKNVVRISKLPTDLTATFVDNEKSKGKKFVHFARDINADKSNKLTAEGKAEEQNDQNEICKPKDFRGVNDKNNNLSVDVVRELRQSKLHAEIPETKFHEQKTTTPFKKSECKVNSGKGILKTDVVNEKRGTDTNGPLNFSDCNNKALNHQEPQGHVRETKNLTALHGSAAKTKKENTNSVSNQLKKVELANTQVNGGSQRRLLTKTNFVKVPAKPEEKNTIKVGTRSAGISALSKLFTSGGNDKSNKTEPKDGKKAGGGLLGRLLYSSEKDTLKIAKQNEKNSKTETNDTRTNESKDAASKEALPQEQGPGEKTRDQSQIQSQKPNDAQQIGRQSEESSLKQGAEQKSVEISQELHEECKTKEQLLEMSNVPPQEQLTPEEMLKNCHVPSWEQQAGEQTAEEELDSVQQMVEVSKVEQTTEKSLLSPPQEKEFEDQTMKWIPEPSQEQVLKEETAESGSLGSDTDKSEPSSATSSPINERPDWQSVEHPQNDHESNLQYTEEFDLCIAEGANTVPEVNQGLVESVEQSRQDGLSIEWNNDSFQGSEASVFVDPETNQILDDEFGGQPGECLDGPAMERAEVSNEALFDSNHEPLDHFSNNLDLLESQETTMDSSALSGSDDAFDLLSPQASKDEDTFGMMDVPSNQDEVQKSSPFGTSEQTGEEKQTGFENEVTFGMMDELIITSHQDEAQSSNHLGASDQAGEEKPNGPDLDIFSSNNSLLTLSPNVDVSSEAGEPLNQPSAFTENILGDAFSCSQDVPILAASDPSTSNSLSDLFGPDMSFSASPSVQADPFTDDFFGSAPQLQPVSQSIDVDLFMDSLLASDNSSTEKAAENAASSNSWMDDLLG